MKVIVSPAMAEDFLSRNCQNRKINNNHIRYLADQMRKENWVYNGQPIIFNKSGYLIDGQHRLTACVASNKPFTTELIESIEDGRAFNTIDTGRLRSANDALVVKGFSYSTVMAAVAKMNIIYDSYDNKSDFKFRTHKVPNAEIVNEADRILDLIGTDRFAEIVNKVNKFKGGAVVMFAVFLMSSIDDEKLDNFLDCIGDTMFTSVKDPRKVFFDYLALYKTRNTGPEAKTNLLSAFIRCFYAHLDGRLLNRLHIKKGANLTPIRNFN